MMPKIPMAAFVSLNVKVIIKLKIQVKLIPTG